MLLPPKHCKNKEKMKIRESILGMKLPETVAG